MSEDECPHGLDARWCSICLHGITKPEPPPTIEATFRSRYDGHCPTCNLPITVGEVIHRLSNDRYVHEDCRP